MAKVIMMVCDVCRSMRMCPLEVHVCAGCARLATSAWAQAANNDAAAARACGFDEVQK